jgi:membrane-bound lytic murein transglycosylase A
LEIPKIIAISLPVVLSVLLVRMQSLAHRELIAPECQVKKWDIPVSLTAENQDAFTQKEKAPLIQRLPVTCCQGDASCLDEVLYGQIPDKQFKMTLADSLTLR